jgi:hypothetical protein
VTWREIVILFLYLVDNTGNRGPVGFNNVVTSIDHALVALLDEIHLAPKVDSHANYSSDSCIHTCLYKKEYNLMRNPNGTKIATLILVTSRQN